MSGSGAGAGGRDVYPPVMLDSIWEAETSTEEDHAAAKARLREQRDRVRRSKAASQALTRGWGARPVTDPRAKPASRSRPKERTGLTRSLRNLYVAQVGRWVFKVLHRFEGRWNGEAQVFGGTASPAESRVVSVELKFDDDAGVWLERQTLTDSTGMASVQNLKYTPTGDGLLDVETDDLALDSVDVRMEEQSPNIMLLTAISHRTGQPLIVETITSIDDFRRVRSIQRFDESGAFSCMYLIREARVIDGVSGAVETYHTSSGTRRV